MEPITDYERFKALTDSYKHKENVVTNCFLLPGQVRDFLASGKLSFSEEGENLLIYKAEDDFSRLYFYATEEASEIENEKPLVAEVPFAYIGGGETEKEEKFLNSLGFKLGRNSRRMLFSNEAYAYEDLPCENITYAEKEDCKPVLKALTDYFNPLYSFLPTEEELHRDIENRRVLVYKEGDALCGLLRLEEGKNDASISQIVVLKDFRRRGIADKLIKKFLYIFKEKRRIWHWVDTNNAPAVTLYKKFGYEFDSRCANEYIKL